MSTGPHGQKRPRDTVRCAIMVAKISTGEIEETLEAVTSAQQGGYARAQKLTKEERSAIARKAAYARWHKAKV